ncbi:MAG: 3'-5' exonuclease, partial [Thermodesulfobacteriota bacterium]
FAAEGIAPEEPYRLETYGLSTEALKRDAELSWGLLENPSRLRVQTIDSLSARIVARMPVLTGLGGRPSLVEEPDEIYEEAARRTIEKVEEENKDGQCVREALSHLDNFVPNLKKRLVTMLKKRDQWLRHIGAGPAPLEDKTLREALEAPVKAIVEDILHTLAPLFDPATSTQLVLSARFAASILKRNGGSGAITRLADLTALPGTRAENIDKWRGVAKLLLTDGGEWRKPTGVNKRIGFPSDKDKESVGQKEDFKALLGDLLERDDIKEALGALKILPSVRYDEEEWSILVALLHLLPVAAAELEAIFAADGLVDFQSVTMAASRALGSEESPSELLLSMDMRLKHLLIDEFQDTSKSHFELIETLVSGFIPGDGRTLFIVGDPMQSIYLFNDADVGLFLKAAVEGVASVELSRIKLTSNFRSLPAIVDWVNATFAPAFPDLEDISSGAVSYTLSHGAVEDTAEANIDMNIYSSRDDALEAADIVDRVEELRAKNSSHDNIAILARSRTHLARIIDELKARDIDFRTTNLDPLIECSVVQDLMSLMRALMHPLDRVAWLAILRAPWCGLSLSDIHALTAGELKRSLWSLILDPERIAMLSPDGMARLKNLAEKMRKTLKLRGRVTTRTLLSSLWIELGGPACLADAGEMENASAFFDLVEVFSDTGLPFSVPAFERHEKKLFAAHNGLSENPVEIMTIHKAKGLEFDHVILPGLGKSTGADKKELLTWIEKDGDMLLAPVEGMGLRENTSLYSYIRLLKAEKLELELTRLLYVASTRARRSLSLYGHATGIKEGEEGEGGGEGGDPKVNVDPRSLLSRVEGSLNVSSLREVDVSSLESIDSRSDCPPVIKLRRLTGSWKPPEPAPALERAKFGRIPDLIEDSDDRPVFDWAGEERKHIGTVLHRYFCRVVTDGIDNWDAKKAALETGSMEMMLRGLGLSKEKAKEGARESVEMLAGALTDKDGRFVLSSHKEDETEYQLTGAIEGRFQDVRIDRTFVDADDVRWIVDYKTGSHKGDLEDFLENEKKRYAGQLNKYRKIFASIEEGREIKCALYYPALGRLVDL